MSSRELWIFVECLYYATPIPGKRHVMYMSAVTDISIVWTCPVICVKTIPYSETFISSSIFKLYTWLDKLNSLISIAIHKRQDGVFIFNQSSTSEVEIENLRGLTN